MHHLAASDSRYFKSSYCVCMHSDKQCMLVFLCACVFSFISHSELTRNGVGFSYVVTLIWQTLADEGGQCYINFFIYIVYICLGILVGWQ